MERLFATAVIYRCKPNRSEWAVISTDCSYDEGFLIATFSGLGAEERAIEYATEKFVDFRQYQEFSADQTGRNKATFKTNVSLRIIK